MDAYVGDRLMTTFWFILTYLVGTYIGAEIGFRFGQRYAWTKVIQSILAFKAELGGSDGKQDGAADGDGHDTPAAS